MIMNSDKVSTSFLSYNVLFILPSMGRFAGEDICDVWKDIQ